MQHSGVMTLVFSFLFQFGDSARAIATHVRLTIYHYPPEGSRICCFFASLGLAFPMGEKLEYIAAILQNAHDCNRASPYCSGIRGSA
jgi:hypothetical protein